MKLCVLVLCAFGSFACDPRFRDLDLVANQKPQPNADAGGPWAPPPLLDDFNRIDDPLTKSTLWVLDVGGYKTSSGGVALVASEEKTILWHARGGTAQAAQVTLVRPPQTGQMNFLFKAALSATMRHLDVMWQVDRQVVEVQVSDDQNQHTLVGSPAPLRLNAGDTFGAEVSDTGVVKVFHNGLLILQADASAWPFHADEGYFGLRIAYDTNALLDDFRAR